MEKTQGKWRSFWEYTWGYTRSMWLYFLVVAVEYGSRWRGVADEDVRFTLYLIGLFAGLLYSFARQDLRLERKRAEMWRDHYESLRKRSDTILKLDRKVHIENYVITWLDDDGRSRTVTIPKSWGFPDVTKIADEMEPLDDAPEEAEEDLKG